MEYALWNSAPRVMVKRIDLIHPVVSGNKWFKLKYNLEQALSEGHDMIASFGGPWSNHLHALAYAAKEAGLKSIGFVRGEYHKETSVMLEDAKAWGMQVEYISLDAWAEKATEDFKMWVYEQYGACFLVPEGGANYWGINGCMEILDAADEGYTDICCVAGTGAMAAGLAMSLKAHQRLHVFAALKGGFMRDEVRRQLNYFLMQDEAVEDVLRQVIFHDDYHFGGYGKWNADLIAFIEKAKAMKSLPLDQIYTGKLLFGVNDLLEKNYFDERQQILVIHSGGLQGARSIAPSAS